MKNFNEWKKYSENVLTYHMENDGKILMDVIKAVVEASPTSLERILNLIKTIIGSDSQLNPELKKDLLNKLQGSGFKVDTEKSVLKPTDYEPPTGRTLPYT